MRLRTMALALALSCGFNTVVQAAAKQPKVHRVKRTFKPKKYKQSKAAKVKPRKAKTRKRNA